MEYAPRRKLTREFKLEAVRQMALSEKPKAQLARELGGTRRPAANQRLMVDGRISTRRGRCLFDEAVTRR